MSPKKPEQGDLLTTENVAGAMVTRIPAGLPAVTEQTPSEITGLLRLAIDKGTPVETLEKLVTLHERVADRMAAQEFAAAMSDFQKECPPIKRASKGTITTDGGAKFSYLYSELDEIAKTIGPPLHARGLSYSWDLVTDAKGMHHSVCTLRHLNGHHISASFPVLQDSRANKAMSDGQKLSAALTLARRQALIMVLGLTNTDPDTDGSAPQDSEPITESQVADLVALRSEVKADGPKLLKYLGVTRLEDIRKADYKKAVDALQQMRRKA